MRRYESPFRLVVALLAVFCGSLWADDWPQWRGPNRDGKSPDTGLLKKWPDGGPPLLWKNSEIGFGYSSPYIVDGAIYITGIQGDDLVITCLDMDGGKQWQTVHGPAWQKNYPGARATPTFEEGYLYLMSGLGHLACYDAKNGKRKWAVDVTKKFGGKPGGWGYAESVLIYKDYAVVTPGGKNCIVALKKKTGKPVWSSKGLSDRPGYASCILFEYKNNPLIANLTAEGLVCVDAKKGRFLWRCDRAAGKTAVCPTPVYSDGYCFAASGYGNGGACVKLEGSGRKVKGEQVWDTKDMVCHHGGYVVVDGHIYGNNGGGWACLDLKTGDTKWNERGVGKGSLCYADGMLYTFSENGGRMGLVPATPDGLKVVSEFSVDGHGKSWAHPVVIGGRLYVRYAENLYIFNVKAG